MFYGLKYNLRLVFFFVVLHAVATLQPQNQVPPAQINLQQQTQGQQRPLLPLPPPHPYHQLLPVKDF